MKIIINAISVKKRAGGVFQIAYNFIQETLKHDNEIEWYYFVSEDLDKVIHKDFAGIKGVHYYSFPTQPDFTGSFWYVRRQVQLLESTIKANVIYTIAAPSYLSFKTTEVMRITNPWLVHPNLYAQSKLSFKLKIRNFLYISIQRKLIKKCSHFITQTNIAKNGIIEITGLCSDNVCVVSNVLPAFFNRYKSFKKNISSSKNVNIACATTYALHKNLDIIPYVIEALSQKHQIDNIIFHITIPYDNSQWIEIRQYLEKHELTEKVVNHGYCTQEQLVEIYTLCEIFFMPTLLEVFSASLLEAMFFNLAIITTNFEFNKDVTGKAALYYKPMDAIDAADKLALIINDEKEKNKIVQYNKERLELFGNYELYYQQTINFLKSVVLK